jgi:hypothetical protein
MGFGFTLERFNIGKELLLLNDSTIIEAADKITRNELLTYSMLGNTVVYTDIRYDLNNFDWNIQATPSPNSFQMNLHALSMLAILSAAYLQKEDGDKSTYLTRGMEILESWIKYCGNPLKSNGNPFVWNDHATALRAENIIFFILTMDAAGMIDEHIKDNIERVLREHAEKLIDDSLYFYNHNHGIFQDRALIYLSFFLKERSWFEHAKKRLWGQKEYAFNDEMIHVENSPGYQAVVMKLFMQIANFLIDFGEKFGYQLADGIERAAEAMCFMVKPNGKLAEIGDTDGGLGKYLKTSTDEYLFRSPHLHYAVTGGKHGQRPNVRKGVYKKTGLYFYREHWNAKGFKDSTWLMFKAGYTSRSHKHNDDLSFMLYTKGHDVFVDCGWYNYVWGNKYRRYLVSANAHNTIAVDGQGYSTTEENSYKVGMLSVEQRENYDYLLGYNDAYNGVYIDRHFYSMKNMFLIYDNIKSDSVHTYRQLFHLSQSVSIADINKGEVLIKVSDTGYFVRIKQLLGNPELMIQSGDFEQSEYGYISRAFNHIDSTTTLLFESRGCNCDFVTLITIEDANGVIDGISNVNFDLNSKIFTFTANDSVSEILLRERPRFDITRVDIESLGDGKFQLVNQSPCPQNTQYAWYVIDGKTNNAVVKTKYMSENNCVLEVPSASEGTVYWLRAYMRNSQYQKKTQIVGSFTYDKKSNSYLVQTPSKYGLTITGHTVECVGENKYRFRVHYSYFGVLRIQWLIYKDGGAKESFFTGNQGAIEYQFKEPGEYNVMYYLRTIGGGENEFYIFPTISIK